MSYFFLQQLSLRIGYSFPYGLHITFKTYHINLRVSLFIICYHLPGSHLARLEVLQVGLTKWQGSGHEPRDREFFPHVIISSSILTGRSSNRKRIGLEVKGMEKEGLKTVPGP